MTQRQGFWCCVFLCLIWLNGCDLSDRTAHIASAVRDTGLTFSKAERMRLDELDAALRLTRPR